jgi:hypothetical protein
LPSHPENLYKEDWQDWPHYLGKPPKIALYEIYTLAQHATQKLKILSSSEYKKRHREDLRLPSQPEVFYKEDWQDWPHYLGKPPKIALYQTYTQARNAAQKLKILSFSEYKKRYREDPRLPSHPVNLYKEDWQDWPHYLGKPPKIALYETYIQAQHAAQELKILSSSEYNKRYPEDPRLPSKPQIFYKQDWQNWEHYLGKPPKIAFYETYTQAQHATQKLKILGSSEYKKRYLEDPRLPSNPANLYKDVWQGLPHYLGKPPKIAFYETYTQAQHATQELKILSSSEYKKRYLEDPWLPSKPQIFYKQDWQDWPHYLGKPPKIALYETYIQAQHAAQELKILNSSEYNKRYPEDPRLPSKPQIFYKQDWQNWEHYLGKPPKIAFYETYTQAQHAAQKLKILSSSEYNKRYREDPRLPSNPANLYKDVWQGLPHYLGKSPKTALYETYTQAQHATQELKILNSSEYNKRYPEDPRLPSNPVNLYKEDWQDWPHYLGKPPKIALYETYIQAQHAAQKLKILSSSEYNKRHREDPRLPSKPQIFYKQDWQDWPHYLGKLPKIALYETYTQAQHAAQKLKILRPSEYNKRYREDPQLPSHPQIYYKDDWQNWPHYLGKSPKIALYETYTQAQHAAQKLKILRLSEYNKRYIEDPRLPSSPQIFYKEEWEDWQAFLLPLKLSSLSLLKHACKVLLISNTKIYRSLRKKYKLPAHPERQFEDWVDWYDLLDIPRPYELGVLKNILIENKCQSTYDYRKMRTSLQDPRIPSSPEETYRNNGWTNTFDFFGKPRPYQVKYFSLEWKLWGESITEFLRSARGGDTKAKDLCEFVREYIEPNSFEVAPHAFLTRGKTNIQPMLELFEKVAITRKKKWLFSINEFLNWIIANDLTLEDDETGEVSRLKGAKNPFSHINFDGENYAVKPSETDKLSLPYQYVKQGREWIFPRNSIEQRISYSDLHHLQKFSADWIQISDLSLINSFDPDCVYKVVGEKIFLWVPIYWTYTYALMQLPARGMQIVYSDSGEADSDIPHIEKGDVVWKQNDSSFAGLTKNQSMVSKMPGDEYGVHYTSNKTHFNGKGYSIPFMPVDLAYWLIKLRNWQRKYNPIEKPASWLDCKRTNLNELQRKQKGVNSFLFRDFNDFEPGTFGGRLTTRLAASLFLSARDDLTVATYNGQTFLEVTQHIESTDSLVLSRFKSKYTPHSMRVSLINAYAYEFGIPIEVIMKLVGHSSLVMQIYYHKSDKTGANLRERMQKGEKLAINNATDTLRSFVETQRIEECKDLLVANSPDFLSSLVNGRPASSYLWKDFGICPVGGNFCNEGGTAVAVKSNLYHPVPAGYLGEQNCIQCRFFITGPAFMIGLAAIFNEISLGVNTQAKRLANLETKLLDTVELIDVISHHQYEFKRDRTKTNKLEDEKRELQSKRRKLNSEIETKAKKMDCYMTDLNSIHKHLLNSKALLRQQANSTDSSLQLIVPNEFQIDFTLTETSAFHQLSEVCENAELFHSCSDELAVNRRSQLLDKMLLKNGLNPHFVYLSEEEQLAIGNQFNQLMLARLKSWEKIDELMDGRLMLDDLTDEETLSTKDISGLFAAAKPLKLVGKDNG